MVWSVLARKFHWIIPIEMPSGSLVGETLHAKDRPVSMKVVSPKETCSAI